MNVKKIIVILVWAVFLILFLTFFVKKKSTSGDFKERRVFKDSLVLLKTRFANQPGLLQHKNNKLYFVSWKDANITQLDIASWEVENIFGKKGRGPTENVNISSFEIKEDSYITYDQGKKSIQEVNFKDSLIYYKKVSIPFFNSVKLDNVFLLSGSDDKDKYIQKFYKFDTRDSETTEIVVEDDLLKEEYSSLINHGIFVKNHFYEVYVTLYNNVFFVFNNKLEYEYSEEMIYEVRKPRFKYINDNLIPERGNVDANQHAYLDDNNFLYILSNISEENNLNYKIVDIYDIVSRKYISSFEIPDLDGSQARELVRIDNMLYVLYINAIASYEIIEKK